MGGGETPKMYNLIIYMEEALCGFSCCSLQGRIGIKIMGRKAEGGIDKGMWARRGTCIQFMAFSRTGGAVA